MCPGMGGLTGTDLGAPKRRREGKSAPQVTGCWAISEALLGRSACPCLCPCYNVEGLSGKVLC